MPQHIRRRVTLRLDSAIQTERRILEQLDALPGRSGTDWLRALLTLGYLTETLDQSADRPPGTQTSKLVPAAVSPLEATQNAQLAVSQADASATLSMASTAAKPFARLRELVG
ncbi:MAG: hypothetical protein AAGG55_06580 [Pseudomonadota bacterium]